MALEPNFGSGGSAASTQAADPAGARLAALFESCLPDVEAAVAFVVRRRRLSDADAEDFASEVKLALMANGYAVLARFQGRSSLRTYLTTVVQRLFLDRQRRQWGKWRPSAQAERLGPQAVELEALIYRDGLGVDAAVEALRLRRGVGEGREALVDLARSLPVRQGRPREEKADVLAEAVAADTASPEALLDQATFSRCVERGLSRAVKGLSPADRILLRLRFQDGLSVADIARMMGLEQKPLYRRFDQLLAAMRSHLEACGVSWAEVGPMVEGGRCHLSVSLDPDAETGGSRTSNDERRR